jgi:hypothetical protein
MSDENPYAPSPTENPYAPSRDEEPAKPGGAAAAANAGPSLEDVPPAPRTPSERARLLLFNFGAAAVAPLIIGGVFILLGALFSSIFAADLPGDVALAVAGAKAHGNVVSREVDSSMRINGVHPTIITFRYDVAGASHESTSRVMHVDAALKAKNAPVEVEYLGAMPDVARIEGTTRTAGGYSMAIVYVIPIVGVLALALMFRGRRNRRRAFTFGRPVVGRITWAGLDRRVRVNRQHPMKVKWRYTDHRNNVHDGSISTLDVALLGEFREGMPVIVLYLENSPGKSTLYLT